MEVIWWNLLLTSFSFLGGPGEPYVELVLSTLIWPKIQFLSIFSLIYLYLPLFTYIWLYYPLFWHICPQLRWFYHIMCHIHPTYMHSSIETAPLCKILEQSDHYSWRYYIGGYKCHQRMQFGSVTIFVSSFRYFTSEFVYNLKAIGPLLMDIVFWRFGGYKCRQRMQFGC